MTPTDPQQGKQNRAAQIEKIEQAKALLKKAMGLPLTPEDVARIDQAQENLRDEDADS